jgi:dienelactone hydrolase
MSTFVLGSAAQDADLAYVPNRFPLIVLSHGTGGSALQMAWLGTILARRGYIAVAVNHPGNNATENYMPQGFSTWWERARNLSTVIDFVLSDPMFGKRIDSNRIGAAGFSLGGYTMIEIAGGVTDVDALRQFCPSSRADGLCKSPPEFPTLLEGIEKQSKTDAEFQAALRHPSDLYHDSRVRAYSRSPRHWARRSIPPVCRKSLYPGGSSPGRGIASCPSSPALNTSLPASRPPSSRFFPETSATMFFSIHVRTKVERPCPFCALMVKLIATRFTQRPLLWQYIFSTLP